MIGRLALALVGLLFGAASLACAFLAEWHAGFICSLCSGICWISVSGLYAHDGYRRGLR